MTDLQALLENYEVNKNGIIINKKTGLAIKPSKTKKGYLKARFRTELSNNPDGRKPYFIHRIVAMAFLDFKSDLQVNHINGDKCDNRIENLEMITASDNMLHSYRTLNRKCMLKRDEKGRFTI